MQDDILGHHARTEFAFEAEVHRFGNFQQKFARAEHEAGIGIADAGGKFVEGAGHAGVRIGAEQNFSGASMAFLRQSGMANAGIIRAVLALEHAAGRVEVPMPVRVVYDIVKIGDPLLFDEIAEDIDVAIGFGVGGKNVMVGDDDHFITIPDFGGLAEFAFEDANGARPANVVSHEDIGLDPDVVSGLDAGLAGCAREYFFSERHNNERTANMPLANSIGRQKGFVAERNNRIAEGIGEFNWQRARNGSGGWSMIGPRFSQAARRDGVALPSRSVQGVGSAERSRRSNKWPRSIKPRAASTANTRATAREASAIPAVAPRKSLARKNAPTPAAEAGTSARMNTNNCPNIKISRCPVTSMPCAPPLAT